MRTHLLATLFLTPTSILSEVFYLLPGPINRTRLLVGRAEARV
jgi:hypothetical protein